MTLAQPGLGKPAASPEAIFEAVFRPTGVDGVYGRSGAYETVVEALAAFISKERDASAEVLRFPPVANRALIEKSGYLKSFPHLLGCVCALGGGDKRIAASVERFEAGGTWTDGLETSDLVLTPAACYPVYPVVAARGPLSAAGALVDVYSYCFRHEPAVDPCRMQMFRMRELVRIGMAEAVLDFRAEWLERGAAFLTGLALPNATDLAHDPFFGRAGKLMAEGQRDQQLKYEMLIPVTAETGPTACISYNYHITHFSEIWPLRDAAGEPAHTGCVAFGIERLALALFRHHGLDPTGWPASVRAALWPEA